jgi:hypothetical protein
MIALQVNDKRLQEKAAKFQKRVAETLSADMRLSAKRTAFYYMEYTLPVSNKGNQWPMDNFSSRVESDVMIAYRNKSDGAWQSGAFELIKAAYSEDKAKEWWNKYKSKGQSSFNPEQPEVMDYEVAFDKMRKIPRKTTNAAYANLRNRHTTSTRKSKALHLDPKAPALAFVSEDRRKAFVKDRQATIGLAKTGWYAADTAIGGQRNFKKSQNEAGRFIWPKECRKIMNRFGSGIGTGYVSTTGAFGQYQIVNSVRYADDAMPGKLQAAALKQAANAMRILFEQRYKHGKGIKMLWA